jgi:hypothetical protein
VAPVPQPISVTITRTDATLARQAFDTILFACSHTLAGPRTFSVASITEAEDAGLTAAAFPWIHRLITVIFSQDPRPSSLLIGRRANLPTQTISVVPTVFGEGYVYSIDIDDETATYEVQAGDNLAAIITGIVAAVDALSPGVPVNATNVGPGTSFTIACTTVGRILSITADPAVFAVTDATTDPGLAADLSAILAENEGFYGVLIDSNGRAEVEAAAGWVETRDRLFLGDSDETDVINPLATTDLMSELNGLARLRSALLYTGGKIGQGYAAAWMARMFAAFDPGVATWAYKTLAGVAAYELTSSQQGAIDTKKGNRYSRLFGTSNTLFGFVCSGEFLDVVHGLDWLRARLIERLFLLLRTNPKLPFTDASIAIVVAAVREILQLAVDVGVLASFEVTAPTVAQVPLADRAARRLPNVNFIARLAGAIHLIEVTGTVSV